MEVEERLAEVAGGGGGVAGGGGRLRGRVRARAAEARERVRRRRPSGARAAAGAGAGERRRRGGRRRGIRWIRWGWANFKVDKVGWAVFMGLSMHLYSCSLLFVFFFCEVICVFVKRLGKRLGAPRNEFSRLGARQWVSA